MMRLVRPFTGVAVTRAFGPFRRLLLSALVLTMLFSVSTTAADLRFRNSVAVDGGVLIGRRSTYRELYGTGIDFASRFEHRYSPHWGLSVRLGMNLPKYEAWAKRPLRMYGLSLTPMATYTLVETRFIRLLAGAGAGANYRRIKLAYWNKYYIQTEFGAVATVSAGARLHLAHDLFFEAAAFMDRQLTGHPDQGDMGDTGGYNFVGGFGFRI